MTLGTCLGTVKDGDYFQLPNGKAVFHNNEWHVITENEDPAAFSLIGFTSGKWSWKDRDGLEKVCVIYRQNAKGDGEIYFGVYNHARYEWAMAQGTPAWTSKALDYAMQEVATLNPEGFEVRVPIKASAGCSATAAPATATLSRFQSDNGRYVFNVQGDTPGGHIVIYDTWDANGAVIADESQWKPVGTLVEQPF